MNISNSVSRGRSLHPDRPAVFFEESRVSYADLDAQACRVANTLTRLGVRAGDRVALCLPNIPEFVWCYLGALKAGAIVVSINPALADGEIRFILGDCNPSVILTTDAGRDRIGEKAMPLSELAQRTAAEAAEASTLDVPPATPAVIVYTSGTTGVPKGAVLSHGNVVFTAESKRHYLGIVPEDRMMLFLPLFHCFGQNAILNAALCSGASVVLQSRFDAEATLAVIAARGVTLLCGVPTHFIVLSEAATPEQLSGVRYFMSAAAPLPLEIERRWEAKFGLPIHQGYGLTETSPFASYNHLTGHRPGSIGTPIDGVRMAIADVETGRLLGPGQQGEIVIQGPNVMLGYWQRPAETREAMRDGWFRSGDIGRMDADGYFYIEDRLKDMIIVGGSNVYPAEVENVLFGHPAVAQAAVYGAPHATLGERVRATVVRKPGSKVTAAGLIEHCRANLARYKLPSEIEFAESLPRNGAGKILKRVLRESAAKPSAQVRSAAELEARICEWMTRELAALAKACTPETPFAEVGFTSLIAVEFAAAVGKWLDRPAPATITWEFPNARAVARHLLPDARGEAPGFVAGARQEIAGLSDEEAEALLAKELARLSAAAAGVA